MTGATMRPIRSWVVRAAYMACGAAPGGSTCEPVCGRCSGATVALAAAEAASAVSPETTARRCPLRIRYGFAEVSDALNEGAERCCLDLAEVGIPNVDYQYDTHFAAAVPGLMLVGIVEGHESTLLPNVNLAPHLQGAVARHNERQMHDRTGVGDAPVWQEMRARGEHRKQNFRPVLANPAQGQGLERPRRGRAAQAIVIATYAPAVEIVSVPGWQRACA